MNDLDRVLATQPDKTRSGRRPRPAPINTAGFRIADIEVFNDRTPEAARSIYSPRSSAQATPQAIVTAIRWQSSSASSALQSSELAFSFSPTSPSYLNSALPSPVSPMETSCLPSGRVLKSPFSYAGSPYPFSPPLSASRLYPNTYRNIPRIDTNVQHAERITSAERLMRTPASLHMARRENPHSADSPVDFSPTTPVTVEVGYPMILDPVTPTIYAPGLATVSGANALSLFRAPPGPVRTRIRRDPLKRGREPYRQDLRGQGGVSQRIISEPRLRSSDELFLAMGYASGPVERSSRSSNTPNKRSRRLPQSDLDGYIQTGQTQSYTSHVTLAQGTEYALRTQISRG